jgi:hypothetical protein
VGDPVGPGVALDEVETTTTSEAVATGITARRGWRAMSAAATITAVGFARGIHADQPTTRRAAICRWMFP